MKSNYWLLTVIFALVALPGKAGEWIRINQLGYLPQSVKVAVFMSEEGTNVENYSLIDAFTGKVVRTLPLRTWDRSTGAANSSTTRLWRWKRKKV